MQLKSGKILLPHMRPTHPLKSKGRITKWPRQVTYRLPTGLTNPGSWCYRRSLLQCLAHLPALYNYLGTSHPKCPLPIRRCTVCALQALFEKYWNVVPRAAHFPFPAVDDLDSAIYEDGDDSFPDARTTRQGDPHEMFLFVVKMLERAEHDS
jgi:hypothetical protein